MSAVLRLLRCLLGVASPSRVAMILYGDTTCGPSWLDRWERRINEDVARRFVPIVEREEVQIVGAITGTVFHRIDVTGRSERARRRVLNKWRRRVNGNGVDVRRVTVFA